jgi:DNA-binding ferritin-like protein
MDLTNLHEVLNETFAGNFVSYYRSHQTHINIVGRNFYGDHKLLKKVYEYFQGNIDKLGEVIRTTRSTVPTSIMATITASPVIDYPCDGPSEYLLKSVHESIETMVDQYHTLETAAEAVDYGDVVNYAQDQIGQLVKLRWMLESTLEQHQALAMMNLSSMK